jgi:proton glutamate symport protein
VLRGRKLALHWQILLALALALGVGLAGDPDTTVGGVRLADAFGFVGTLFLRALKMLVVPLILSSIIASVAAIGPGAQALGRLGSKTLLYYLTTSALAVLVGLLIVNVIRPGVIDGAPARERIGLSEDTAEVAARVAGRSAGDVVGVFLRLVPENVIADAAEGQMLGLIFFALLFGYFATYLPEDTRGTIQNFWSGTNEVILFMTDWVLRFAPIGVFGLVARTVLTTGIGAFGPLAVFFFCVVLGLLVHAALTLPLLLRFVGGVSPLAHYRVMAPALLMAFSTASSSATLPLTLERVEHAGVSRRVSSFTLPLGATVNMDGTALYECVAAVFIAQAYGVELGFGQQLTIVVVALLTSIGVAGIPAASLVAITLILTTIGLPLEGIGLILAVDRVLDMCRTAVNVLSDSTAAVVIARTEGEGRVLQRDD